MFTTGIRSEGWAWSYHYGNEEAGTSINGGYHYPGASGSTVGYINTVAHGSNARYINTASTIAKLLHRGRRFHDSAGGCDVWN